MNPEELALRLARVRERLERACAACGRRPGDVLLVAVSKFHPASDVAAVAAAGQVDFGENYVQEALEKRGELAGVPAAARIRWHMIGHVQSRKAAQVAGAFVLIHTLDSVRLADALERRLADSGAMQPVLMEINIGEEPQKAGVMAADAAALAETVRQFGPPDVWQKRAEEWRPSAAKEKPWKLVERWEERYGTSPALERLRYTAVFHASMAALWETVALGQEADLCRAAGKGWESGAVRLMTLHAAKGLEFPAVFVAGVRAGALPLESMRLARDWEEERRLLYVGMTRAREELILTTSPEPSPFLEDLPGAVERVRAGALARSSGQLALF